MHSQHSPTQVTPLWQALLVPMAAVLPSVIAATATASAPERDLSHENETLPIP